MLTLVPGPGGGLDRDADAAASDPGGRSADQEEDARLLAAIGAGDRGEPLRLLYQRYAGRLFGFGLRALGDRGLAEELVQETFVRLWRMAGRYEPARGAPSTFIFVIARRLAIDLWRRPSSRPLEEEVAVDRPDLALSGPDHIERMLVQVGVQEALESLSPAQREVLELSYQRQMKQTEIAAFLGIPLGTVKTRTYHGLRSLRVALQERGIHG